MPPTVYVAHFTRVFAGAHRVWNDPGLCHNLHGHNYTVSCEVQTDALTEQGFTTPFGAVKDVIDQFDHALVLDESDPMAEDLASVLAKHGVERFRAVPGVPSTEVLATVLAQAIAEGVLEGNQAASWSTVVLSLRETAGIESTCQVSAKRKAAA